MKSVAGFVGILCLGLAGAPGVQALPLSYNDLWDVSQGATVTATSGALSGGWSSDARNMFGGTFGSGPSDVTTNTIFKDYQPAGYMHWVEWHTAAPVTLGGLNLVAAHDSGGSESRDINYRGFRHFTLYTGDGLGNWTQIYSYTTDPDSDLDYGGGATYPPQYFLELTDSFGPLVAQYFRAEFVQYGNGSSVYRDSQGPRIVELDGLAPIPAGLPEPGVLGLVGLALASFAVQRRRNAER